MQSIEPRNEQLTLRQFWKKHPTYNLNAMMRRRYEELMDAKAFNEWVANRRLKQEGEDYADAMGRVTEAVNRRIPQLRAGAERQQVLRAGDHANGEEHHGVGRGAGLRSSAAAEAESCRVGRQGVVHKDGGTVRAWLPAEAEPINLPTGAPASSCRATSTSTTCPSPRSRWTRTRGRTRSWGRASKMTSLAPMRATRPGPETDSESGPDEAFRGRRRLRRAAASVAGWAKLPCEVARQS